MMALHRTMALLALAAYVAFLGIVAVRVGRVDLGIVILIGIALAGYDIWSQLFRQRPR
jgi:hypothetical protein